ncbi:hypothetical protein BH09BAC3_BH09BAC3_06870 [soil metagenome]
MSSKTIMKKNLKNEKAKLHEQLSSLKKTIGDFKVERKANWKAFKNSVKDDVNRIKRSIDKLSTQKLSKRIKIALPTNGAAHGKVSVTETV